MKISKKLVKLKKKVNKINRKIKMLELEHLVQSHQNTQKSHVVTAEVIKSRTPKNDKFFADIAGLSAAQLQAELVSEGKLMNPDHSVNVVLRR